MNEGMPIVPIEVSDDFADIGCSAFEQLDVQDAVHLLQTLVDVLYPVFFYQTVEDEDGFPAPYPLHLHGFEEYITAQ